jgi:hypothetical protein
MDYSHLSKVLTRFRPIAYQQKRPPTFMEITSYPHLENVASNVLAFYFDPNAEHRLGSLLLEVLLSSLGVSLPISNSQGVSVSREVSTGSGRIDLLIEASPDIIVAIENKIFHNANNNPFAEYEQHVVSIANGCPTKLVLLTVFPIPQSLDIGNFQQVLYKDLFRQVLDRIGQKIINAESRYLTFLLDFIQSTNNLYFDRKMNNEFLEFLKAHEKDIIPLIEKSSSLQQNMKKKARSLEELLKVRESDSVKVWSYIGGGFKDNRFRETVGYKVNVTPDYPIWIAADLTVDGWDIRIKDEEYYHADGQSIADSNMETRLSKWLEEKQIPASPHPICQGHLSYGNHFAYDADLVSIDAEITELLNKITH